MKRLFASFILLISPLTSRAHEADWATHALRLSGESTRVYQRSVQQLKATPRLEILLATALTENTTHTFLALDVISTLQLTRLLPTVIALAKNDQSGFFYLTLNTFMNGPSQKQLIQLYQDRLNEKNTPASVKMVLLDTLGRMNVKIKPKELAQVINDRLEPEAQSAALYYLRTFLLKKDRTYEGVWNDLRAESKKPSSNHTLSMQLHFMNDEMQKSVGAKAE